MDNNFASQLDDLIIVNRFPPLPVATKIDRRSLIYDLTELRKFSL